MTFNALFERDLLEEAGGADTRVVEQEVEPASRLLGELGDRPAS